ncbi:pentapeptide repeat-containing protein [Natronorubrum halophilum]|uniref:pentapeptide repeat-containing protein n=1 Tax=Natronorubrum halophilum TaxID=1702106 RepID=UPI0010C209FE|nr:pentapeptide repeat-containing protein [Natronorubrum halophilum]
MTKCKYKFNARQWSKSHVVDSPVTGIWTCPHEAYNGVDLCPFHLSKSERDQIGITDDEVQELVYQKIQQPGYKEKQFIDANLPGLDFSGQTIESKDERAINFAHSTIDGPIRLGGSVVDQVLVLSHAEIRDFDAMDATFSERVYFSQATFHGACDFSRCCFESVSNFKGARFHTTPSFATTEFETASFEGTLFRYNASFFGAQFTGGVDFNRCYLGNSDFKNCCVEGSAMFRHTVVKGLFPLNQFKCEDVYLGFYSPDNAIIDLGGAELSDFTLTHPYTRNILYNISHATLGDGHIQPEDDSMNPFSYIYFNNVNFDGFDFSSYHSYFEELDWEIHSYPDKFESSMGRQEDIDTDLLESTYLKAKNGAKRVGDVRGVSKFTLKELRFRRMSFWENGQYREGLFNLMYGAIAGYGEKPSRVILTSVVTVVAFAEIYGLILSSDTSLVDQILQSYTLSLQAFVSVVFGGGAEIELLLIRLLVGIQGFIGAFLIALFVYSLTISVTR